MKYGLLLLLMTVSIFGQRLDLSRLDALASRAREAANVDLDADKLKLAKGLLPTETGDTSMMDQMTGVFVRMFEFDKEGDYSPSDLDAVRAQMRAPNWSRIVDVKDKKERVEVWMYTDAGKPGGLTVLMSEPKEMGVVNIVGPVDLQNLHKIGGAFGVHAIRSLTEQKKSTAPEKKEE